MMLVKREALLTLPQSLSERERRYSTTEKEAFATVYATRHFRVYLLGRPFTVVTDHNALRWLHSIEPKGRLARWIMDLQEFSFTIKQPTPSTIAQVSSFLPEDQKSESDNESPELIIQVNKSSPRILGDKQLKFVTIKEIDSLKLRVPPKSSDTQA